MWDEKCLGGEIHLVAVGRTGLMRRGAEGGIRPGRGGCCGLSERRVLDWSGDGEGVKAAAFACVFEVEPMGPLWSWI